MSVGGLNKSPVGLVVFFFDFLISRLALSVFCLYFLFCWWDSDRFLNHLLLLYFYIFVLTTRALIGHAMCR